jgi:quercetin dioxygenase-like cupin family protein
MIPSLRMTLAAALMGAAALSAHAAGTEQLMSTIDATGSADRVWKNNPSVPAGMKIVSVYGDPSKPGPYLFRAQIPAGYILPAHRHPDQRMVTVLSGTYLSGIGERFDEAKLQKFGKGAFYITEPGVPHFARAETDVVIQEMGIGPVQGNPIDYLNPAEDPRKH